MPLSLCRERRAGKQFKPRHLCLTSMTSPNLRCRVAAMLARIACSTAFTTHGRWKVQRQPPSQVLQGGHGGGGWRQAAAGGRGLPGGCCPHPLQDHPRQHPQPALPAAHARQRSPEPSIAEAHRLHSWALLLSAGRPSCLLVAWAPILASWVREPRVGSGSHAADRHWRLLISLWRQSQPQI